MNQFDQYTVMEVFTSRELRINAPRERVWPILVDYPSFNQTIERVELLSGVKDAIGSICRLTKRQGEWWSAPYLVKIVHLDPGKQIIWKSVPEQGEDFTSLTDFSVSSVGDQTVFTVRVYKESRLSMRSPEAIEQERQAFINASDRLQQGMLFPNIKRLAEQTAR